MLWPMITRFSIGAGHCVINASSFSASALPFGRDVQAGIVGKIDGRDAEIAGERGAIIDLSIGMSLMQRPWISTAMLPPGFGPDLLPELHLERKRVRPYRQDGHRVRR